MVEAEAKRLATLAARAALRGVVVHEIQGDFGPQIIASRWALTRSFDGPARLDAIEGWLDRVDRAPESSTESCS